MPDRRRFLALGAAAAGLAACGEGPGHGRRDTGGAAAPGVVTQPRVRWRLASSFPASLGVLYGGAETFAARVAALTDGRFEIEPHEAGELVPALQVMDAVQNRSVEVGATAGYYYLGKTPLLAFDTSFPFGMTARQHDAWMREGGGLELTRRTLADFGIVHFTGGNTGVQMGGWFREPVRSLADLRGLRMRLPGLGARVMERLGVVAQMIPGGEIYQSLERGAIDATEWVGPYDDERLGFHEVVRTYHYPGWWEPSASISFYVNRDAYERLPSAYREALASAAAEANAAMLAQYDALNPLALARLVDGGVDLVPFPDDVMRAARREADGLIEEIADAEGAAFRELLDHYRAFQRASDRWLATAEMGQMRAQMRAPARRA